MPDSLRVRFILWNKARREKRMSHKFTKFDERLGRIISTLENNTILRWTGEGVFYCYTGKCDHCGAPNNYFRLPIIAKLIKEDKYRKFFLTKHTIVCPGCHAYKNTIGIFKSAELWVEYDLKREQERLEEVRKLTKEQKIKILRRELYKLTKKEKPKEAIKNV